MVGYAYNLTAVQRDWLIHMLTTGNGFCYEDRTNVSMNALKKRGLVGYSRGAKYGKAHWSLTDEGMDEAKHMWAQRRGFPHAVFLTPSTYEMARRIGEDMINYVIQKPIPAEPLVIRRLT